MPTRTTGLLDIPDIEGGPITVRIGLRNYRSRSGSVRVVANRFLSTGRSSEVFRKTISVTSGGANYVDISSLQGSTIDVTTDGPTSIRPSVSVVQSQQNEGYAVLFLLVPKQFTTL